MKEVTAAQLKEALLAVCNRIIVSEDMLTQLDTIIGDGDHGYGMRVGFSAMEKELNTHDYETPYDLLWNAGLTLIKVMGGTSGVIFGTFFIGGLDAVKGKKALTVQDFAAFFDGSTKAIHKRGQVDKGDKTMYDALAEGSETMNELAKKPDISIEAAFQRMAIATRDGVEKTRNMMSQKGRSKNFRDKTIGHPDTGAVSTYLIIESLSSSFSMMS